MRSTTSSGPPPCGCSGAPGPDAGAALSRRSLLRASACAGVLGTLGAVAGGTATARYAFAAPGYTGDVVVILSLRGGFDGLNAVVPAGDPHYAALRPTIGIPAGRLIRLNAMFGLHPAMSALRPFWNAGQFAAVHAVGQADPTRSHFQATAELERAAPGTSLRTGWLDRTVGLRPRASAFAAAQIGSTDVSGALAGPAPDISMASIDGFALSGAPDAARLAAWTRTLTALHRSAPPTVAAGARGALGAVATAGAVAAAGNHPAPGAVYPATDLGRALRDVVRLVKAGVGLQVACVDYGNWDMHANVGSVDAGWMHDQLTELAGAMAAFAHDLGPALADVVLVTLSEFGRRAGENGSGGLDHGHGNAVLLLGGGVIGGRVYGHWPGLAGPDLVDGDLAGSTDYRLVLGEILAKRCRLGSLVPVFPGLRGTPLGVVRPRP